MKILEVQHVVKTYGSHQNQVTALSDVSFAAEQGEFIAIVGTSGFRKKYIVESAWRSGCSDRRKDSASGGMISEV